MLSVAEAALKACVSESLVRAWIAEGTLPCYRMGRKGCRGTIRIQVEDLDQVLATFKVVGGQEQKPPVTVRKPKPAVVLKHLNL